MHSRCLALFVLLLPSGARRNNVRLEDQRVAEAQEEGAGRLLPGGSRAGALHRVGALRDASAQDGRLLGGEWQSGEPWFRVGAQRAKVAMESSGGAEEAMTLTYFPVMAKGLGPALVCEFSGLPWRGPKDTGFSPKEDWPSMKAAGKSPFGQLPLLEADGLNIGQSIAIVNYVGRKAGPTLEGQDAAEFALSQSLLAEGEDLYAALQKWQPTIYLQLDATTKDGMPLKGNEKAYTKLWTEYIPSQIGKLERLLGGKSTFTASGTSVGELYLWAMLHQIKLCDPEFLDYTPNLMAFYENLEKNEKTQRVITGQSSFGPWTQYFVNP